MSSLSGVEDAAGWTATMTEVPVTTLTRFTIKVTKVDFSTTLGTDREVGEGVDDEKDEPKFAHSHVRLLNCRL